MIESYLDKLSVEKKSVILTLRQLVLDTLPDVEENLSYKMPSYYLKGKEILAFAAQKNYFSVYIMQVKLKDKYASDFAHLSSGKSCIRFKTIEQFPLNTLHNILLELKQKL